MIGAIFSTDMAQHFSKIGILKGKVSSKDLDPTDSEEKKFICEQLFHLCDISNACKPFELCENWTLLLFNEFYLQGDMEKKHGHIVSQFMDRCTTNIAQSQIGFINFIIQPSFEIVTTFLPKTKGIMDNIARNKEQWQQSIPEYEAKMEEQKKWWADNKDLKRNSGKFDQVVVTEVR